MSELTFELRTSPQEAVAATTIVVAATHAIVRAGLRTLLEDTPGFVVVGEAEDARTLVKTALELRPDAILLDELPADEDGRRALTTIREGLAATCVLCLGDRPRVDGVLSVPSNAGVGELCQVLGVALNGQCGGCLLRARCPAPMMAASLSRREKQVAVCIAAGMASKQIAAALGIALRTVNTYRESLARKIGASSAAVVTRYVLEQRLTADDVGVAR